jgi:hypothetical protein
LRLVGSVNGVNWAALAGLGAVAAVVELVRDGKGWQCISVVTFRV